MHTVLCSRCIVNLFTARAHEGKHEHEGETGGVRQGRGVWPRAGAYVAHVSAEMGAVSRPMVLPLELSDAYIGRGKTRVRALSST